MTKSIARIVLGAAVIGVASVVYSYMAAPKREPPAEPRRDSAAVERYWGEPDDESDTSPVDVPVDLVLHGTLATDHPGTSTATISAGDGSGAANYQVGDTLPGGAVLVDIAARAVRVKGPDGPRTIPLSGAPESSRSAGVRTDTPAASREVYGLRDGEEGLPLEPSVSSGDREPLRTRSGPVLSPEERRKAEALALED